MPLEWSPRARKDLRKLPEQESRRIIQAVNRLLEIGHGDVRPLKGFDPPRSRLRVGDYRAIFREDEGTLLVLRVRHRRDAY